MKSFTLGMAALLVLLTLSLQNSWQQYPLPEGSDMGGGHYSLYQAGFGYR